MSKRESTIQCIYCKKPKPRPSKGEHIILAALGGRATIREVCSDCNRLLGRTVDQRFLESSFTALHRYYCSDINTGEVVRPQFLPFEYGMLDIRVLNDGSMDILPQVALIPDGTLFAAAEPDQSLVWRELNRFLSSSPTVHLDLIDDANHVPTRLVIDRSGRSHLLRSRSHEDADRLVKLLSNGVQSGEFQPWTPPQPDRVHLPMDFNIPGRCAAKMALNMACYVVGSEVILRGAFDPVRKYILGEDVISGPAMSADGEQGVRVDYRFVDPWVNRQPLSAGETYGNWHAVILGHFRNRLTGLVLIYGGIDRFKVHLGPFPESFESRFPVSLKSDIDDDWWSMIEQPELRWRSNERPVWDR
jgi:hypothetical protein